MQSTFGSARIAGSIALLLLIPTVTPRRTSPDPPAVGGPARSHDVMYWPVVGVPVPPPVTEWLQYSKACECPVTGTIAWPYLAKAGTLSPACVQPRAVRLGIIPFSTADSWMRIVP